MKIKKLKVGITGNIGSGKSTFASYLHTKGIPVINADELSKEILANDSTARSRVVKAFGKEVIESEKLNTNFLAGQVFSDKRKLEKLNSILHPLVLKKIDSLCAQYFKSEVIVLVEAALIYEIKIEKQFDIVVVIAADDKIRKERAISSGIFTPEQFVKREANQIDQETKIKKADFVFYNNDSVEQLYAKADLFSSTLKSLTS